jgi:SWI/SNF chromatin-remodeling complex subunit SWI1
MFSPDGANASAQPSRGSVANPQVLKSRREEFLKYVAGLMNARQTPLPLSITGIPSAYDPATSPWKSIEPMADPGGFRLAGKDVDLFKLWQLVLSQGGHAKVGHIWSTNFPFDVF